MATSLFAFMLSGFAGGMVAQIVAEATFASEEFILVFIFVPLLTIAVTVVFFVAQFPANARASVDRVGRWLLGLYAAASAALTGWQYWADAGNADALRKAMPLLGALIGSGLLVILVHWLFVRWRVGRPPVHFGRDGQPA